MKPRLYLNLIFNRLPLFLIAFCFLFSGCHVYETLRPQKLVVRSGNGQTCKPGEICEQDVVISALSFPRKNWLGMTSKAKGVAGVVIAIEPVDANSGAQTILSDYSFSTTDFGGDFRCKLQLGKKFGDQYFKVTCPEYPDVDPVYVYAVAGVEIQGDRQETYAGQSLPEPIRLIVKDEDHQPVSGLPVFFTQIAGNTQARLSSTQTFTDDNGVASVQFTTAEGYTGKYDILAEIGSSSHPYHSRGIIISELVLSRTGIVIGLLGGLGIFIFGMTLMSNGLQQIAGDKLKTLLQLFAGNRLKAVLAGVIVTSLIQSSGATTVMVVGFVNAGLLQLQQAIGIILGAAIGTTITAQVISFKLDGLALPCICLGVLILLCAKKSQWKGIGNTILGFGLLFYGMMLMSSEMKTLADFPSFANLFQHFNCTPHDGHMPFWSILGAIGVGTLVTVIMQSSSATVGVTIALAESGLLNYYTAIPLILGDNIGSTITGLCASIGTTRTSKQAATAATIFKILAVLIAIPFFYLNWNGHPVFLEFIEIVTPGCVFAPSPANIGRHLANAHSLFNILSVMLFLPFTNLLAMITKVLLPSRKEEENRRAICFLEPHLLNIPSAALDQVLTALITMAREALDLTKQSVKAVIDLDSSNETLLREKENQIDQAQKDIIAYLVKLTRRNLSETQSNIIPQFMHCVNDVERIGDRAINIYDLIQSMPDNAEEGLLLSSSKNNQTHARFSDNAIREINEIQALVDKLSETLLTGLKNNDQLAFDQIPAMEEEVKKLTSRFEQNHETRLKNLDCTVQKGIVFVELLANLERIVAHLANLADRAKDMSIHKLKA